ncbi:MAG: 4Fe-4S binding protein [Bacteroidales bacterium]|jgi:MinD superfamily P-loop ATPase|nr:4Fe-4S binding protein [Bacteroidales bacterium]
MEIAIISGKGGTGKSSISAAFATLQKEVVLADCDVDAANLFLLFNPVCEEEQVVISGQKAVIDYDKCIACGECIDYCRFDAIVEENNRVKIIETFCDGCLLCSRICPQEAIDIVDEDKSRIYAGSFKNGRMVYGRLAPGEENTGKIVSKVRDKAKQIAKESGIKDIIIDGPPGIGCSAISSITGVDAVVVVTEPTLSGLHDLKRTLEITSGFKLLTSVIINKYDINEEMSSKIEEYCAQKNIEVVGKYPFDPLVVEAMVNCQSITDFAPDAEISKLIKNSYLKFS